MRFMDSSGGMTCFLSGAPIINLKDFSREHYVAKQRAPAWITGQDYNIRPALKVINNIKGADLPCEWHARRIYKIEQALDSWNLSAHNQLVAREALRYIVRERKKQFIPCNWCILRIYPEHCPYSR